MSICPTRRLIQLLSLAVMSVGARVALAQSPRVITFDDAVKTALAQSNVIRLAKNANDLTDANVRQARAQFLPDVRLSTQGAQNYGRFFSSDEGKILNTQTQSFNTGLSSSLVLFNGMANKLNVSAAKANREASEYDLSRSRETVVFTVLSNYLTLIEQQEQLRVSRQSLAAQDTLERQVQEFVNAGTRSIADLYQQQAGVASARLTVVQGERAVELAKVDLIQTLKLDPAGVYEFQFPPVDSAAPARSLDVNALVSRALQQRRDVDAEQSRVNAAQKQLQSAGATVWPTLSLNLGYNSSYASSNQTSFLSQLDQRRGGSFGLSLSIPIFDRYSTRINSERAQIGQQNAEIALDDVRQQVALQVKRATLDYVSAGAQLDAALAQTRAAELALQAAQERYLAGAATLVEVTQARATSVQAASALVSARYNLLFQGKLLDYYVGDLDPKSVRLN